MAAPGLSTLTKLCWVVDAGVTSGGGGLRRVGKLHRGRLDATQNEIMVDGWDVKRLLFIHSTIDAR